MSYKGKMRRSTRHRREGKFKAIFNRHIKKYGKWRGKKWDGTKLLGTSLKSKKKK